MQQCNYLHKFLILVFACRSLLIAFVTSDLCMYVLATIVQKQPI